jgi:heterodisulfide reductase subunit A-like polyferredoxin/coenzyme F420-reducing hydrogenase delta subunit
VAKKTAQTKPDVGVVVCDCGRSLQKRMNFSQVTKRLNELADVAAVKVCSQFCRESECAATIESLVSNKNVKRLVIGACNREVYNEALNQAVASDKINDALLGCVNIREHCGWVSSTSDAAASRTVELLSAAVRRIQMASEVKLKKVWVNQDVLVLGGGLAGMQTAVALSRLGHKVTLLEQSGRLGGMASAAPELYGYVADNLSDAAIAVHKRVDELIRQVEQDRRIVLKKNASLRLVMGELGNFTAVFNSANSEQVISVGAIILVAEPVTLQPALSGLLGEVVETPRRVAIVLDLLDENGRAATSAALSMAEMLVVRFGAEVKLYCRNVRVASAGLEGLYRRARRAGVVVFKYDSAPEVLQEGTRKIVSLRDPIIGRQVREDFDLVLMADDFTQSDNGELKNLIEGLKPGQEGELQVDNVWFEPGKTNRQGIFVVGLAAGEDELRDSQVDGLATAEQVHELLKDKQIEVFDDAAVVDSEKCVLCLTCMRICPHGAVSIDEGKKSARVSLITCQRCGICAAECPVGAIQLPRYTDEQIRAELGDKPRVVVFACENSAYPAATTAAILPVGSGSGSIYDGDVQLVSVPCVGKVDPRDVLSALQLGAEKVVILGCHLENCKYISGSSRAAKRFERISNELEKVGVDRRRIVFGEMASVEPYKFLDYVSNNGVQKQ